MNKRIAALLALVLPLTWVPDVRADDPVLLDGTEGVISDVMQVPDGTDPAVISPTETIPPEMLAQSIALEPAVSETTAAASEPVATIETDPTLVTAAPTAQEQEDLDYLAELERIGEVADTVYGQGTYNNAATANSLDRDFYDAAAMFEAFSSYVAALPSGFWLDFSEVMMNLAELDRIGEAADSIYGRGTYNNTAEQNAEDAALAMNDAMYQTLASYIASVSAVATDPPTQTLPPLPPLPGLQAQRDLIAAQEANLSRQLAIERAATPNGRVTPEIQAKQAALTMFSARLAVLNAQIALGEFLRDNPNTAPNDATLAARVAAYTTAFNALRRFWNDERQALMGPNGNDGLIARQQEKVERMKRETGAGRPSALQILQEEAELLAMRARVAELNQDLGIAPPPPPVPAGVPSLPALATLRAMRDVIDRQVANIVAQLGIEVSASPNARMTDVIVVKQRARDAFQRRLDLINAQIAIREYVDANPTVLPNDAALNTRLAAYVTAYNGLRGLWYEERQRLVGPTGNNGLLARQRELVGRMLSNRRIFTDLQILRMQAELLAMEARVAELNRDLVGYTPPSS